MAPGIDHRGDSINALAIAIECAQQIGRLGRQARHDARGVVDAACLGDLAAARVILQPFLPRPRDRAFAYELPPLRTVQAVADAMGQIIADITAGELTIAEGEKLTRILERKVLILRAQETGR